MRRAMEGVLTRLRERVAPGLSRLDCPRIPRSVICRDRMDERIVVGPGNGAARGDLDALRSEHHRTHLGFRGIRDVRRPFAAFRRRLTSPPEVAIQRERDRELEPAANTVEAA